MAGGGLPRVSAARPLGFTRACPAVTPRAGRASVGVRPHARAAVRALLPRPTAVIALAPDALPFTGQAPAAPRRTLRVLVGVQDEGMNGVESYAEQVALAACAAGHRTTLLVTNARVADAVRARVAGSGVHVVDAGLAPASAAQVLAERLAPALATRRVGRAVRRLVHDGLTGFDVVHLNRARLAPAVQGAAPRVFCAGWFYPHAAAPRLTETWRHTRGAAPRRLALTAKSLLYYLGDARGYQAVTAVVACTETLAAQLRARGVPAAACPPPVRVDAERADASPDDGGPLALLVCSGDLSHPRKNLGDAVRAAALLARPDRPVVLRAIGHGAGALPAPHHPHLRVECLGPLPPAEVRREMRRAHAFLLPSLYEEWGYVAVESILSGTPVVAYPVYPFADMLADGLGAVATAMTVEAFAAAVGVVVDQGAAGATRRGPALAAAGARRFGPVAVGARLTSIWDEHP